MALVTQTFSDIITFTRASSATYFDATGTLQTATTDQPRFDYNPSTLAAQGLLIEEARTNLLTYSAEFDNAAWTKSNSTITADVIVAPDGTLTGDKLVEDIANAQHNTNRTQSVTLSATYSFTVYAKAAERTFFRLQSFNALGDAENAIFDLATGTVVSQSGTSASTITPVGNGWYRCSVIVINNTDTSSTLSIQLYFAATTGTYTGDGTSGIYIWGAQLEAGAFPTSYIPTVASTVTRAADVATVNTLSPWYSAAEGTVYFEGVTFDTLSSAFPQGTIFSDGTNNNRIGILRNNSSGNSRATVANGGATQFAADGTSWTLNAVTKAALAYEVNNFAFVANGGAATTDTSGTLPTVDRLRLGVDGLGSSSFLNGYLRRITYYPRRLSNADLQAITS